ncbi:MAG: sugar transferase [Bacteroidota bacterium]
MQQYNIMNDLVVQESGKEVYDYFLKHTDIESEKTLIVSTTTPFNILNNRNELNVIINLTKVNHIRFINKFFETVNGKLKNDNLFLGCFETYTARRKRKQLGKIPVIKNIYFGFEFILLRIFPKIWGFKKIYFLLTRGKNRLLSKSEVLGRLVSCGFEIKDYQNINELIYFVAKKIKEPTFDMNPSYGFLYKMPRIGKNGKIINVYKLRTMHPYAEYLQDYILLLNGYEKTGKPANDFRITPWGKFMRRYWLDELPQLINVLSGDLKLVGVRPVSKRYFQDIPKDLQELRLKQKPGCIPPYVALNRKGNLESVLKSDREYLEEKIKHPYTTDTKYFCKAVFNILVRRKRSA